MREITGHHINDCNKALVLLAEEPDPTTGAIPSYLITARDPHYLRSVRLAFQNGPVADGINGITQEVLTEVLIDRLEYFQQGPFAHPANAKALEHYKAARDALRERTAERTQRGVEGTHTV